MARRGSFGAQKRQKELRKKQKREEKLERKRLKKMGSTEGEPEVTGERPAEEADAAAAGETDNPGSR